MSLSYKLATVACLILLRTEAQAQVKDMPSQAELDPILENADEKVKDFLGTLTKYRAQAAELDNERLQKDLHDFATLREMIHKAHSGPANSGAGMGRILGILATLDDAALEAAVWSNLLTARVCGSQEKAMLYFAMAIQTNGGMLREVSGQLLHPALRMANATDEIITAIANAPSPSQTKPR